MSDMPKKVLELKDILSKEKIWFKITNNHENQEALTCRDAVQKRTRLGYSKIPLLGELKTYLGFYEKNGRKNYVMVHCRGNQELDANKIENLIGTKLSSVSGESEIEELYGSKPPEPKSKNGHSYPPGFGLINPFWGFSRPDIIQIFDNSLIDQDFIPYTMMTNASHRFWTVEFKPKELIDRLPNASIADVVEDKTKFIGNSPKIGIITGNSPDSGILLWRKINRIVREKSKPNFYGDISAPYVSIRSIPEMGLSMELCSREAETWEALRKGIVSLCKEGVEILCIACNTTQYFSPKIKEITSAYGARFISIPEVTLAHLEKEKIKEFAFLGVKYVTGLDKKWSAFKELRRFKIGTLPDKVLEEIDELAFTVKQEGSTEKGRNKLRDLFNKLRDLLDDSTESQNIVVALTELSILLDNQKKRRHKDRNFIDTLELLAEAVADEYIRLSPVN